MIDRIKDFHKLQAQVSNNCMIDRIIQFKVASKSQRKQMEKPSEEPRAINKLHLKNIRFTGKSNFIILKTKTFRFLFYIRKSK